MIHHIFKIIWNERKSNGWILLEYILVFCTLWFCTEYLYHIGRSYIEPMGFNIENTYRITMSTKNPEDVEKLTPEEKFELAQIFSNRTLQYPGVKHIGFSRAGLPYYGWFSYYPVSTDNDSVNYNTRVREVTKGFFDVFELKLQNDLPFDWSMDNVETHPVILSPDRNDLFHSRPVDQVRTIRFGDGADIVVDVIGTTDKLKDAFYKPYEKTIFQSFPRHEISLTNVEIVIRTVPGIGKDFPERFIKEMRERLNLDPYFIATVESMDDVRADYIRWNISEQLNSTYAITAFLFFNIFLGVTGTFWYRTQSRRSEIGLRMALGASRRKIKTMLCLETIFLLFIASLIAANISLQIRQAELFGLFDLPVVNRVENGLDYKQDLLNYFTTFGILAILSLAAVWLPASQISAIQPSEALRDE